MTVVHGVSEIKRNVIMIRWLGWERHEINPTIWLIRQKGKHNLGVRRAELVNYVREESTAASIKVGILTCEIPG